MNSGKLFLVATPIGNLKDMTFRGIEVLKEVAFVLCEDTRHSERLFREYNIKTPKEPFHDFNKERKSPAIIAALKEGKSIALISDAGTPGISDPGFYLVREAVKQGVDIIPVPGANAMISALVASGLATDRFVFEGFLPRKSGKRKQRLDCLKNERRSIIFYESPHRVKKALLEISQSLGNRDVCLGREITKINEEFIRGSIGDILSAIESSQIVIKGEFVIVVAGKKSN